MRSRILIPTTIIVVRYRHRRLLLAGPTLATRLHANLLAEAVDLLQDHLLHLGNVLDDLEVEVEGRGAVWLVRGVVPDVQVAVLEGFLDRDARRGVEGEHAVEKVEGVGVGLAEEGLEGDLLHEGQVTDVVLGTGRADAGEGLLVGCAEIVQDLVELIDVVSAFEEGLAA